MEENTLILMMGLPRSGKTTLAKKISTDCGTAPIVNPDSVRLCLHGDRYIQSAEKFIWAIVDIMIRSLFMAGHKYVIVDGCHNTKKRRLEWAYGDWRILYAPVDTSREICLKRARDVDDQRIIPHIERMADNHEPLDEEELKYVIRLSHKRSSPGWNNKD
ncbi:hypothetical protein KAR91_56580 [Candidatus Pacearchaeota archaeon]|nr:hypothetical protein [Candidatus Pacearchaeota archaeon]